MIAAKLLGAPTRRLIAPFIREHKVLVARLVATGVGRSLATTFSVVLIQQFLVATFGKSDGMIGAFAARLGSSGALVAVAVLMVGNYVTSALLYYDHQVTQERIVKVLELGVMERIIRHLLTLSIPFFDRQSHGDILQAVRQDVVDLRRVTIALSNIFAESTMVLALLAGAAAVSPVLALWGLVLVPVVLMPVAFVARRMLVDSRTMRMSGHFYLDAVLQIIVASRVIKTYRAQDREAKRAVDHARKFFEGSLSIARTMALARITLESLAGLGLIGVIVVGGFQVMRGALLWPDLFAFIVAVRALNGPVNNINMNYLEVQTAQHATQRIVELLDERSEIVERSDATPLEAAPRRIRFEHVGLTYGEGPVLRDISLDVAAGETIGIVGASGAGKSSILSLLARFYDPTSGRVLFDDRDLRDIRLADLYETVALVTQNPFVFADSVRENIRYGRPSATDAEIERAARASLIHDEIVALPQGYDTIIGGAERRLSRGQEQRLNIARAFVKNAPVLLLDEATASIDAIAEQEVQEAIERLYAGRTTFIVAHRLSALAGAHRIIVLDQGVIVASGKPNELIRRSPIYRQLWEAQQNGRDVATSVS